MAETRLNFEADRALQQQRQLLQWKDQNQQVTSILQGFYGKPKIDVMYTHSTKKEKTKIKKIVYSNNLQFKQKLLTPMRSHDF